MANQIIIDIGAVANDGTGDPLRTAFGYVNNNFSNVWASGVANSNIQFDGNRILTVNTNGNLILSPNGIGKVQANVDIVPNINNAHSLGAPTRRWNTVYTQYIDVAGDVDFAGNVIVSGNLIVQGDTIQLGNIVTDTKTIQLANTAGTTSQANGSGITVGANDNIATLLYNSTGNVWTTNIGISSVGNITAPYFIGNGSQLTGIIEASSNAQILFNDNGVIAGKAGFFFNKNNNVFSVANAIIELAQIATVSSNLVIANTVSSSTGLFGNISANSVFVSNSLTATDSYITRGTFAGDTNTGDGALYVGSPSFTDLGTDVMAQFTGNVVGYAQINLQNYGNSNVSSGDYIITADNGNDTTHFIDMGITGANWDGSQPNSLGNRLGPNDGYLYVQDGDMVIGTSNGTIETWKFDQTGNLTVPGDILPTGNNTQSLGNATNQWADLWISNSTIYMNSVPITLGAGNVLTVNGEALLSNDSNTTITTTGNITADYFFGNGSQLTGLSTNSISDGNSSVAIDGVDGNAVITTNGGGGGQWTFDTNGVLTLAGSIVAKPVGFPFTSTITNITTGNPTVIVDLDTSPFGAPVTGKVLIQGVVGTDQANDTWYYQAVEANQFQLFSDAACTIPVDGTSWTAYVNGGTAYASAYDSMAISTGGLQVVAGPSSWYFGMDGNINIPGDLTIGPGPGGGGSILQPNAPLQVVGEGANSFVVAGWAENTSVPGNIAVIGFNAPYGNSASNVLIQTGNNATTTYSWVFDNTGNLNLPQGGTISEGASPSGLGAAVNITPANGTDADQQLKIYPTFGEGNHLHLTTGNLYNTELYVGDDNLYVKLANTGDVVINSNDGQGNTAQWTFGTNGGLTVPTIYLSEGAGEVAQFVGTRKLVNGIGFPTAYAVFLSPGGTPTVAYTASSSLINSVKVTFAVQSSGSGFQWEQFDVVAVASQDTPGDVNFVVSNRIKAASTIGDTAVTAAIVDNKITITLTLDAAQTSGGTASFDAVEFGLMID